MSEWNWWSSAKIVPRYIPWRSSFNVFITPSFFQIWNDEKPFLLKVKGISWSMQMIRRSMLWRTKISSRQPYPQLFLLLLKVFYDSILLHKPQDVSSQRRNWFASPWFSSFWVWLSTSIYVMVSFSISTPTLCMEEWWENVDAIARFFISSKRAYYKNVYSQRSD